MLICFLLVFIVVLFKQGAWTMTESVIFDISGACSIDQVKSILFYSGAPQYRMSRNQLISFIIVGFSLLPIWEIKRNDWKGLEFSICYWRISVTLGSGIAGFNCIFNNFKIFFLKFPWNTAKMVKNLQTLKTLQICYLRQAKHNAKNRTSLLGLDHDTLFIEWPVILT